MCVSATGISATHADTWPGDMVAARDAIRALDREAPDRVANRKALISGVKDAWPREWDWALQDAGPELNRWLDGDHDAKLWPRMIQRVFSELGRDHAELTQRLAALRRSTTPPSDAQWLDLYAKACGQRRRQRLATVLEKSPTIVFTKHHNMGGSHYAYTEAQSDAQNERHFTPGASLCVLEMNDSSGTVRTLLDDREGVIRDPAVSYDGKRIVFAWKQSDRQDDYHLYEMDVATTTIRQLTFGLGFADYEPAYLPGGDIVFSSTRCVQTVDCWWTEVSNLYTCDKDGRYLRRLGVDQVHTNSPTVTDDGRVIYTRWEYSDRGQIYPQSLFEMNPDGTHQWALYGNNSWFPTTILHARGLPGSQKIVAILTGHHSRQTGKLAIIDPARGQDENSGVQLIAPVRETSAVRVDQYGQKGELFQYPYPLSETEFLVAYDPAGWAERPVRFKLYWVAADGRRELLTADPAMSCNQPIPLAPRHEPQARPSSVDYRKKTGTYYLQDVYAGSGLAGVPRGTIKSLRVVALAHRAAGIRSNRNQGPAGGALVCTPVSIGNGTWDVKIVLGEAKVYADGSSSFPVPARTPVFFQALDGKGRAVQTMRSWSTLQPGETSSCVGCHQHKGAAPPARQPITMATKAGPQPLTPFYGPPRGFSFVREIQPILDRHCISCHHDRTLPPPGRKAKPDVAKNSVNSADGKPAAFSLLGTQTAEKTSGRRWSDAYLALTQATDQRKHLTGQPNELVNWVHAQSAPPMLPPYHAGAARSRLLTLLEQGHYDVKLDREAMDKLACWIDLLVPYCGDYTEANAWSDAEISKYDHFLKKRRRMEAIERKNIAQLIEDRGR